jgi:hypothetical protein
VVFPSASAGASGLTVSPTEVVKLTTFEIADQLPRSSAVRIAIQYGVLVCSPLTNRVCCVPAGSGAGAPETRVAEPKLPASIGDVE